MVKSIGMGDKFRSIGFDSKLYLNEKRFAIQNIYQNISIA